MRRILPAGLGVVTLPLLWFPLFVVSATGVILHEPLTVAICFAALAVAVVLWVVALRPVFRFARERLVKAAVKDDRRS